jgi:hypothetical protein
VNLQKYWQFCHKLGIVTLLPEFDILDIILTSLQILQRHSASAAEWTANFGKFAQTAALRGQKGIALLS